MIQVCDPPRQRQVRRLSAEEFFTLVRCGGAGFYRPCSEVLRMLTVGEVWGVYSTRGVPGAGCILLPMDADVAAAAALRRFLGWNRTSGGYFLTPAAGPDGHAAETLAPLLAAAAARQEFLAAGTVGRGGMCGRRADPAVSASGVCFAGYPPAGQSGTVFSAAGRVPCAECAAGMAPAGRPGAHCHPAGSRLCRAGKPRKPAGHGAGTVSRMM